MKKSLRGCRNHPMFWNKNSPPILGVGVQARPSLPKRMHWRWLERGDQCPLLTSEAGPLSAPGQEKVTNSWHRLCTTKQQTAKEKRRVGRGEGGRDEGKGGREGMGGKRSLNPDFTTRKVLQQNEHWLQLPHLALYGNHTAVASYKSVQLLKVTRVQKITNAQNDTPSPKDPFSCQVLCWFWNRMWSLRSASNSSGLGFRSRMHKECIYLNIH